MTSVAIIFFMGLCLTAADSRNAGPLPQNENNGVPEAQAGLIEQLKQEMLEQIQVQADKYDKQIKEQSEKHEQQITELTNKYEELNYEQQIKEQSDKHEQQIKEIKVHDIAMQNVISEMKRENEAIKSDNEAIKGAHKDNTKLRELLGGHNKRLMILEGDLATSDNSNKVIHDIPKGDSQIFTNISNYNQEMSSGVVAFQARSQGFTGTLGAQIPFELVDVNIGDAYDPSSDFTAPVAGIYQISYEVLTDDTCGSNLACVYLTVNGVYMMKSCSDYAASGGSSMILQLMVGDTVSLNLGGPCYSLHDSSETYSYNQFSGHLLYEVL